jgi:hypothetical protein
MEVEGHDDTQLEQGAMEEGDDCDNSTRDNSVLSPKPLLLVIKR